MGIVFELDDAAREQLVQVGRGARGGPAAGRLASADHRVKLRTWPAGVTVRRGTASNPSAPGALAPVTWRDGVHLTGTPIWCDARRRRDVCFVSRADRIGAPATAS